MALGLLLLFIREGQFSDLTTVFRNLLRRDSDSDSEFALRTSSSDFIAYTNKRSLSVNFRLPP